MSTVTWEKLKQQPISIGLMVLVMIGGYYWTSATFFTKVEASELVKKSAEHNKQITDQIATVEKNLSDNTKILNNINQAIEINSAIARVKFLDDNLYRLRNRKADPETLHV